MLGSQRAIGWHAGISHSCRLESAIIGCDRFSRTALPYWKVFAPGTLEAGDRGSIKKRAIITSSLSNWHNSMLKDPLTIHRHHARIPCAESVKCRFIQHVPSIRFSREGAKRVLAIARRPRSQIRLSLDRYASMKEWRTFGA